MFALILATGIFSIGGMLIIATLNIPEEPTEKI